jgi:hypothetical protein
MISNGMSHVTFVASADANTIRVIASICTGNRLISSSVFLSAHASAS